MTSFFIAINLKYVLSCDYKRGLSMIHLGTVKLETKRLVLRRLELSDAKELFEGLRNQDGFCYYANKEKVTLEQQIESFKSLAEKYENLAYYNWAIVQKSDGKIVGAINFKANDKNDSVEFSYATDEKFAGRGYMTEALNCVTDFAFSQLKANRVQGGCSVKNLASKRVMEKCGFEFEGTLKQYLKLRDGYHDMHMFSKTK